LAAVAASNLHIARELEVEPCLLDGRSVARIPAFLFHRGGHDAPRLAAHAGSSFVGSDVLGMGFTFDDMDTNGKATPLAEMHRLLEKDPRNREVVFPRIDNEEVNTPRPPTLRRAAAQASNPVRVSNARQHPKYRPCRKPHGGDSPSLDNGSGSHGRLPACRCAAWKPRWDIW